MTPRYGRCEKGQRLIAHAPFGHWKTTTFIGALRYDGLTAPCVFDGPINGDRFRASVEQILVPTLKPGDLVLMDNLASQKVAGVRQAIEAAGAERRFLPPLQPRYGPHRTGVRQGQKYAAQNGPPNRRRRNRRRLPWRRPQLLPKRRICVKVKGVRLTRADPASGRNNG